jgi:hypothetical protein
MKANRFFRTVWRVNGVLILAVFVVGAAAAAVGLIAALASNLGDDDQPTPTLVQGEEHLAFGPVEQVDGTSNVILPLTARHASKAFSSGGGAITRNLLFYDGSSHTPRWLRPDHRGAVVAHELLRESRPPLGRGVVTEEDVEGPVRWIRYELADLDTDGDGDVTDDDAVRVAVSGPGGEDLAVVVGDAEEILGYAGPRDGTLLVFFRRGDGSFVADVDLTARKLRTTAALPAR